MSNNYTRFLLLPINWMLKMSFDMNNEYKTSIICAPEVNKAGVLYGLLAEFKRENINLTRLNPAPVNGSWVNIFLY